MGLLGTLLSGAAYVPLEPTYPVERLRFMAADAGLGMLLVQQGFEQLASSLRSADGIGRTGGAPDRAAHARQTGRDERTLRDQRNLWHEALGGTGDRRPPGRRSPRLHHLHLRLDRPAQGGDELPRRPGQPPALDDRALQDRRRGAVPPEDPVRLRRLGLGAVRAAGVRRAAGDGPPRRAPGPGLSRGADRRARHHHRPRRAVHAAGAAGGSGGRGVRREPAPGGGERRGPDPGPGGPVLQSPGNRLGEGPAAPRPLRPDGDGDRGHPLALPGARLPRPDGADGADPDRPAGGQRVGPGGRRRTSRPSPSASPESCCSAACRSGAATSAARASPPSASCPTRSPRPRGRASTAAATSPAGARTG